MGKLLLGILLILGVVAIAKGVDVDNDYLSAFGGILIGIYVFGNKN